jgi:hypothetical protein
MAWTMQQFRGSNEFNRFTEMIWVLRWPRYNGACELRTSRVRR